MKHTRIDLETLAKILARMPRDKFVAEATRLVSDGEMPSADLLRRCGVRVQGAEVIA